MLSAPGLPSARCILDLRRVARPRATWERRRDKRLHQDIVSGRQLGSALVAGSLVDRDADPRQPVVWRVAPSASREAP
jgi:hypothetical protein